MVQSSQNDALWCWTEWKLNKLQFWSPLSPTHLVKALHSSSVSRFMLANAKAWFWGLQALLHIPHPSILPGQANIIFFLANIILGSFFTSAAFLCCAPALSVFVLILRELHLAAVNHLLFPSFSLGVSHISAKSNVSTIDLLLKPWWQFLQDCHFDQPVCSGQAACTESPALRCPVSAQVSSGTWAPCADLDTACMQSHSEVGKVAYLIISFELMSFLVQLYTSSPLTVQWETQALVWWW